MGACQGNEEEGSSGRRETVVNESRKETADRVARHQTDYVGRTCLFNATRTTTNCGGCLEGVFVVLRFSCPFLSLLVVFCFLRCCIVSFCLSHLRGGATPLFYFMFLFFYLFPCPVRFSLCQRIWIATICISYLSCPVRRSFHCLLTTLVCSISVSWFCNDRACISLRVGRGRIGTDTGCSGCRRVARTV